MRVKRDRKNEMAMLPASLRKQPLLLICLALAVISFGCATMASDPPFPPKVTVVPPGPEIPKVVASMSGVWSGQVSMSYGAHVGWHALIVHEISPANDAGVYLARVTLVWWRSTRGNHSWTRTAYIQPDGAIRIDDLTRGFARYVPNLAAGGRQFIQANWTWSADNYGSAVLTHD
jgi:hypothetical protein